MFKEVDFVHFMNFVDSDF